MQDFNMLIESFLGLDLQQNAYQDWIETKKHVHEDKQKDSTLTNILLENLDKLSKEQVDALISRLIKNKNSFEKWLKSKNEKLEREAKQKHILEQKKLAENLKKFKIQQLRERKVEEWSRLKRQKEKEMKHLQETRHLLELENNKKKQEIAAKKYKEWKMAKKNQPRSLDTRNKQPWVSILPTEAEHMNTKIKVPLSPPSLYNEYKLYEKQAPNFLKKYPNFVALAGFNQKGLKTNK